MKQNGSSARNGKFPLNRNISAMFTTMSQLEQEQRTGQGANGQPTLEGQLKYLNSKLLELNEEISQLEFQRGRVRLKMQHVAREIQRQQASTIKEQLANGKRL